MAHLALVVDPDPARRARFAAGVRELFAELPDVVPGEATAGDLTCVWAAGPRAPVDLHHAGDHLALLVGYAVDDAGRWLTARQLADAWLADEGDHTAQDGYHVGVALVATTPQALLAHPLMHWNVDRLGLAGILLAHGLLDDRPLLAGARRLPMGHRLRARPHAGLREQRVFDFMGLAPPAGETFAEARDRIADLLLATLSRHRPPGDDSLLMLSGGLDSRLVAGCLADLGIPTRAVTFGRPRDYEVRAATAVAERLGLPLERISTEDGDGDFTPRMRQAARFSHLSSGPGGDDFAVGLGAAATTARFHWSGVPYD